MTEYDYSPEAYERYLDKQLKIARWVDTTHQYSPSNPFTIATPHIKALKELNEEEHHRSSRHSSRHRRDEDRYHRDRDRHHRDSSPATSPTSSRPSPTRHRSSSHSVIPTRPTPIRSQTAPGVKDPYQSSSKHSSSRPSHSRRSSNSSATTRPQSSGASYYPPPKPRRGEQMRSNTTPAGYGYPNDNQNQNPYAYTTNQPVTFPGGNGYVVVPPNGVNVTVANQVSWDAYQTSSPTKQVPLLKRLFTGLTGGSKSNGSKSSRRSRRSSF
ncbi:hypothetical protein BDQ12DRAFT_301932 [Crucibulum laeve]|uniref:Uncharacterized protein n=1 Tax=Crucibulum laeve TaxID=68775 RepID=A0A5C3MC40_9AGAR|nr:hypothetical protein BDQ12DRAFT_301932 [Crucibulum laeve]